MIYQLLVRETFAVIFFLDLAYFIVEGGSGRFWSNKVLDKWVDFDQINFIGVE